MYKDIVKETIDMIFTNIEKCNKSEKHNNVYVYEIAKINLITILMVMNLNILLHQRNYAHLKREHKMHSYIYIIINI